MRTAIYVRVSTEEQAREGYSIAAQLKQLKAFCVSQDWEVREIYVDEGVSAKNTKRPKLRKMIKDIEGGLFDVVLVYRLDRLTRSVFDLYKLLEVFEKHDCKFKSATEVYDTTSAMGRMFITIVAALAQWERENLGERVAMGFREKLEQGKCPLSNAPFGYTLDKENSVLKINPHEAHIVRFIFNNYLSGLGSTRLCRLLNEKGYLTRKRNLWRSDTLFKILKSPVPAGGINWAKEIHWDMHEPIIPRETWDKVQRVRERRRGEHPITVSSRYHFSGLVKCDCCGKGYSGTQTSSTLKDGTRKTYYSYRCSEAVVGGCETKIKSFSERSLEESFIEYLSNMDFTDAYSDVDVKSAITKEQDGYEVGEIEDRLAQLEAERKKWQYAWLEGMITDVDFKKRMEENNAEKASLEEVLEMESDQGGGVYLSEAEMQEEIEDIVLNWQELTRPEKKVLLAETVKEIKIEKVGVKVNVSDVIFL